MDQSNPANIAGFATYPGRLGPPHRGTRFGHGTAYDRPVPRAAPGIGGRNVPAITAGIADPSSGEERDAVRLSRTVLNPGIEASSCLPRCSPECGPTTRR